MDVELNQKQLEEFQQQEKDTDLDATGAYVLNEANKIDNFAIELPMCVEEKSNLLPTERVHSN